MTEFLTADTSLPPYMVFPRFLLDTELNETTKLLYVILLDRSNGKSYAQKPDDHQNISDIVREE